MNSGWAESWDGIKLWLNCSEVKQQHTLASVSQMQQREKGMGKIQEKKRLERPKLCIFVGRSN